MTDAERRLLEMAKPQVTLQWPPNGTKWDSEYGCVAENCCDEGWLRHVKSKEYNQEVYELTPAGADALTAHRNTSS